MKRIGNDPEPEKDKLAPSTTGALYDKYDPTKTEDILASMPSSMIDAAENDNFVEIVDSNFTDDDPGPAFPDPPEVPTTQQKSMNLHSDEFYKKQAGFVPAIEHPGDEVTKSATGNIRKRAQPAKEFDLENLDESMIMDMPEIKAASYKIIDMLDPKPKDKSIRFRWANCKNHVAGNLGKYLASGFQVANIDDVDQNRTPIDESMKDGTQIKYYDVILLKINVIRLMELYKTNIIKSVNKLAKAKEKGLAEASRQFQSDLNATGQSNNYNLLKQALGKNPVEFFATE